jgi:hypothetical protein
MRAARCVYQRQTRTRTHTSWQQGNASSQRVVTSTFNRLLRFASSNTSIPAALNNSPPGGAPSSSTAPSSSSSHKRRGGAAKAPPKEVFVEAMQTRSSEQQQRQTAKETLSSISRGDPLILGDFTKDQLSANDPTALAAMDERQRDMYSASRKAVSALAKEGVLASHIETDRRVSDAQTQARLYMQQRTEAREAERFAAEKAAVAARLRRRQDEYDNSSKMNRMFNQRPE